jgi:CMP-2-keto-3-deoxyoctulosonic acid synthetase
LIEDRKTYGRPFIEEFMKATGGFLHLLDVAELLRIVQAAEMIAARGTKTTPMMALDYYLMERAKKTLLADTLCIEVLLRFADT